MCNYAAIDQDQEDQMPAIFISSLMKTVAIYPSLLCYFQTFPFVASLFLDLEHNGESQALYAPLE
jgi:predicted ABC-type sugar transport system permease subunit